MSLNPLKVLQGKKINVSIAHDISQKDLSGNIKINLLTICKNIFLLIVLLVVSCITVMKVDAASAVNDYIINNKIQPANEQLQLGRIHNQNPAQNGGINMDFTDGIPKMVVIHEVGVDGGTINGSIDFMVRTQDSAFVHSFVDGSQLITIADKNKKSWGAGPWANKYAIQIEQMRVSNIQSFYKEIASLAKWTATQMDVYGMGEPKLMSSPSTPQQNNLSLKPDGNLASHKMISYKFNQTTNHVDPDAYWARFGYDMSQFRDLVAYYYNQIGKPLIISTAIEGNPSNGKFNVRIKTSGNITSVKVPIWSNINGQDDLYWYDATKVKDGEYLATFDAANHNYESGRFTIHAYAYNNSGQAAISVSDNTNVGYPATPVVHYQSQVQDIGWQESVIDGETSGTIGQSKRIEAIKLAVTGNVSGGIQYRSYIQGIGWQDYVANNALSGTQGQSLRVEAINIDLTGTLKEKYDIYYRVQLQGKGWLGWAKNGASAGSQGYALRLESMQVKLVSKGSSFDTGGTPFVSSLVSVGYQTHVQQLGWQENVYDGAISGSSGQGLRLEGIKLKLDNLAANNLSGNINYQTHVQRLGWQNIVSNGEMSGTSGQSLRLEAIRINLSGEIANVYDIYYRVHIQQKGWLGWAKNGASAGSQGLGYRLEAIQVLLVKKGASFDTGGTAFIDGTPAPPPVSAVYQTHVQQLGWQENVHDGEVSGSSGQGLRLEGIKLKLDNLAANNLSGNINYQTHVQRLGWQNIVSNGEMSGTSGQSLRLEAIRINLSGEIANVYDIYYRVHIQQKGWLGWAKNGASAGSQGLSYRLEAIQVLLVKKGASFDVGGSAFIDAPPLPIPDPTPKPAPAFDLKGVNEVQKSWFDALYTDAQRLANQNDLFPSVMMSQAIAESAWGQSELARNGNNLFGVKADASWQGDVISQLTSENTTRPNQTVTGYRTQADAKSGRPATTFVIEKVQTEYYIYANFRKYANQAASLQDYVTKIKTTKNGSVYRYQNAWRSRAGTYQNAAQALQSGGYATDPNYAANLINRINNYKLYLLD